jgi:uncharacterized protein
LGVPQDYAKARDLYEKATAKGNNNAIVYLGRLYEKGRGVKRAWRTFALAALNARSL